jgi:hypothetical protein
MTLLYQPMKTKTTITSKMTFLQQPVKKKTINMKMVAFTTACKSTINKMTFLQDLQKQQQYLKLCFRRSLQKKNNNYYNCIFEKVCKKQHQQLQLQQQ